MSKDDRELIEGKAFERREPDANRNPYRTKPAATRLEALQAQPDVVEHLPDCPHPRAPVILCECPRVLQAQPVGVVQLGASDQFQWPTESDWQGQTEDQRARFLRSWYDYLKAAALQSPQPLEDEARHALIDRLQDYRSDWHKRMGDVSVLDAAIAALTASPPVVEREALEPFATFYPTFANEDGWTSPMTKERIVDWFGPSDFRRAAQVFATLTKGARDAG